MHNTAKCTGTEPQGYASDDGSFNQLCPLLGTSNWPGSSVITWESFVCFPCESVIYQSFCFDVRLGEAVSKWIKAGVASFLALFLGGRFRITETLSYTKNIKKFIVNMQLYKHIEHYLILDLNNVQFVLWDCACGLPLVSSPQETLSSEALSSLAMSSFHWPLYVWTDVYTEILWVQENK